MFVNSGFEQILRKTTSGSPNVCLLNNPQKVVRWFSNTFLIKSAFLNGHFRSDHDPFSIFFDMCKLLPLKQPRLTPFLTQEWISTRSTSTSLKTLSLHTAVVIATNFWTSGVPQGSILGPLLFLVFVSSLPKVAPTSRIYKFADDTKIMYSNPMELQEDLDRFVQWCDQNKIEINVENFHLMMFRGDDSQKFRMKDVNLQTSPLERDLGVVISEDLSWVEQTKTRCNKAYRAFFNLKRNTSPQSSLC